MNRLPPTNAAKGPRPWDEKARRLAWHVAERALLLLAKAEPEDGPCMAVVLEEPAGFEVSTLPMSAARDPARPGGLETFPQLAGDPPAGTRWMVVALNAPDGTESTYLFALGLNGRVASLN